MRILHYIDRFDFGLGGVVQYVFQICQKLADDDTQVTLFAGSGEDIPAFWQTSQQDPGTPTAHRLTSPPRRQGWLGRGQLDEIVEVAKQHDVVHLHGAWDFGNLRLAKQLSQQRIPYIASPHGMLDDWSLGEKRFKKSIFLKLFVRKYFENATVVHCTAKAEIDQVRKSIKTVQNFFCVPPFVQPIDLETANAELVFDSFPEISRDLPKLLFLSRLHPKKGPEFLLDAAGILMQRNIPFQVLMVGPGDEGYVRTLKERAKKLGIAEHVVWTGLVKDPLKTSMYLASDIFVLATHQENFGIVLAEAMLAGVPVVTTRGTDIYQEVEQHGAVIAETNADSIASNIEKLIANPEDRNRRSELGKQGVAEWLSENNILEGHRKMYQMAIERNQ